MAALDSGLGIVEAASTVEAPVTTTDSPVTETPAAISGTDDLQVIDSSTEENTEESAEGKETETKNADGTEKTEEQKEDFRARAENRAPLPAEVRSALKQLKADPKNAAVVKQLHGHFERYEAIKEALGTEGPNGLKTYLQEVGAKNIGEARETMARTKDLLDTVTATDELLYKADKKLWENVYEDLKSQNKADQYGKNAENMLDHLKSVDAAGYYAATKPHMVAGLAEAQLPTAINTIWKALADGNVEAAKGVLSKMADWYNTLQNEVSESGKAKSETEKLEAAKASWESDKQKAERTTTETSVATDCEKKNNTTLGKHLGGFLKLPFFKDFPRETLIDLGNGIKERLYAALKADKGYQTAMSGLWKAKTIDSAKMVQVHQNKLDEIAERIVRETVQSRYPGYAKGGMAAGRAAAATDKKAAVTKAGAASIATGKPIYIASKPTNLQRADVSIGGRKLTTNDLQVLEISGKGYVKSTDGKSWRYVTWRR